MHQRNRFLGLMETLILLVSMFIVPSLNLIPRVDASPDNWWDTNWNFRKPIAINHTKVTSDLQIFPILIDVIDSDLKKARTDGYDIVFTDGNGMRLNHEIEFFDKNTGHLAAWVNLPLLSSAIDTKLYMYYGNLDALNQQNSTFVWDSNFVMVQHLNENFSTRYDSTINLNSGTAYGGLKKSVTGKIDGADEFDGLDDYVKVPNSLSLNIAGAITIEGWFRSNRGLMSEPIGWYGGMRKSTAYELEWQGWTDGWTINIWSGQTRFYLDSRGYMPQGQWHYVVGQYDGQYLKIFFDGQMIASKYFGSVTINANNNAFLIGRYGQSWNGTIDEVRVSNVARSPAWLLTGYNNQKDPSTFYTIGNKEVYGTAPLLGGESPSDGATEIYTNPLLSVNVADPDGENMTVLFRTNASGAWNGILKYDNVRDGTYSVTPTNMDNLNTTYYWSVCATDGGSWTNKTYRFTTTARILTYKWMRSYGPVGFGEAGVLIADVDGNNMEEVVYASTGHVTVLNGTNGNTIWSVEDNKIGSYAKPQIADLDCDGNLEIVVPLQTTAGLLVLHGNDGSVYWRRSGLGRELFSSPVICDIDGDGYPEIFVASTDVYNGLNGTGRLTSLTHDGQIIHQTFTWRACGGGLSIADTDHDGEFELYMGDRDMYMNDPGWGDNGYGRGVRSFWAKNLTERWSRPEFICSSSIPVPADVDGDGILDIIVGDLDGGVVILNSTDGSIMNKTASITDPISWPVHYQFSVYDIDLDGNLEMMMADGSHSYSSKDIVVLDLVKWKIEKRLSVGPCFYGPQLADVTGDGIMEMIACSDTGIFVFDNNYDLIANVTGLEGVLNYAVVQDIDGDGYNELVVSSQEYRLYVYDTPARRPNPRPRSEVQFYSEYRLGATEYVPPPGCLQPVVSSPSPANHAKNVNIHMSELQFTLTDYQHDMMNLTVTTNPNIGSHTKINVGNGRYIVNVTNPSPSTTYTWTVSVTDGTHSTNKTYTFTTESLFQWWNTNWKYRKAITIDHSKVSADLSSFPVLIDTTDSDLANHTQADADDIVFTDTNGNQLPHEIELYNNTMGHLIAWVNVPFLSSSTNTKIYMYYGNPVVSSQQNSTHVWDSNFLMVQHLEEGSSTRGDSTINLNNGTALGNLKKSAVGKVDGADEFDGVNDYVNVPNSPSLNVAGAITIEGWFRSNRGLTSEANGWYGGTNKYLAYELGWQGWTDGWTINIWSGGSRFYLDSRSYMPKGEWHYVVGQYDGQYLKIFLDGQMIASKYFGSITINTNKNAFVIGRYGQFWNGTIDEVRVSNVARSLGWIFTSYNNQKDPSTFYTIGNEESIPKAPIVFAPSPPDEATGIPTSLQELSFDIIDLQGDFMNYTVTTNPNIGSDSGTEVSSGRYHVSVSNLQYSTTYTWTLSVTDGTHWTDRTFTFTTYPSGQPTHDTPKLVSSAGNLTCSNQTTYDPEGDKVTNIYNWYKDNVSITNLLLPFNTNSSTIVKDYSSYGHDGTIIRGATWTNNGKVGGAYRFDRGFIQIPGTSTLDGGGQWSEITVEHWIYLAATQSGTRTIAKIPSYEIGISGNKIFAGIWIAPGNWEPNGYQSVTYNTALQTNRWYHVAFTYKSGVGLTLYIDGNPVATKAVSGNIQSSGFNPLYIGWFDYFKGMIDEVRIYPKSLSSEQIHQRYIETKDGLSNSSTIVYEETYIGDVWRCEVTPNDSHQDGTTKSSNTVTIGYNNPPMAKALKITPSTPKTNDNLIASYTYFDPDGNPESGTEIRWYKNGILQPGLNNTLIVPHALTNKTETWYFTVRPKDGLSFGVLQTSPIVSIQNTSPSISGVTITPNPANATDALTANPVGPYDADGDVVTYTYQWQKYENGTWVNIPGATNQTLGPENFAKGDQIKIICTPYDGQDYGTPKEYTITISNS